MHHCQSDARDTKWFVYRAMSKTNKWNTVRRKLKVEFERQGHEKMFEGINAIIERRTV